MALPSKIRLQDVVDDPSIILRMPLPWGQEILEQLKKVVQLIEKSSNVPPTPIEMAVKNPRYKWMDARHLHYLGEQIAAAVDAHRHLIVTMPPRHAKPVSVEELVLLRDGRRVRLGDVEIGQEVLTHRGRFRRVSDVIERPAEPVLRLKTWCGRSVTVTPDHPMLTPRGWILAADLRVGDVLGTPTPEPTDSTGTDAAAAARLAGYFVGDGNTSNLGHSSAANITCFDEVQAGDMAQCAEVMGFEFRRSTARGRYNLSGGVRQWLRDNNLVGTSRTKRVPQFVLDGGRDAARNFIAGYFACDGCVQNRGAQRKTGPQRKDFVVEMSSVNRSLVDDVQHLLLRLGIKSRIRKRSFVTNYSKGSPVDSYHCILSTQDDVDRFRREIPVRGVKAQRLAALDIERQAFDPDIFADPIVSIEDAGVSDCRCLTVEEDHSFTANDIAVKNSHTCSVWTPFWFLALNPEGQVFLISSEANFARKWGVKTRGLVEMYGSDYGLALNPKKVAGDDWELTTGGGMKTVGAGGLVSGNPAKLLICDDLVKDDEEARSDLQRDNIWEWWDTTVIQRIEPDTTVIVIGTRYHEDDIIGRLLKHSKDGSGIPFDLISLPALAEADDPIDRGLGEGLWPEHFEQGFYDSRKNAVSSYSWESVYQQHPSPPGGNMVDPAWWRFYRPSELPELEQEIQTWDLALDSKKKSDSYHAGLTMGRKGALVFLRDSFRKHCNINEVIETIQVWNRIYPKAKTKLVERSIAGPAVVQMLQPKVGGMVAWPPKGRQKGSKEACLNACVPDIRSGNVLLPLNPDGTKPKWVQEFIEELRQFPRSAHDDYVDSFSQGLNFLLPSARQSVDRDHSSALAQKPVMTPQAEHVSALHALVSKLAKPKLDALRRHTEKEAASIIPFSKGFNTGIQSSPGRRTRRMW